MSTAPDAESLREYVRETLELARDALASLMELHAIAHGPDHHEQLARREEAFKKSKAAQQELERVTALLRKKCRRDSLH